MSLEWGERQQAQARLDQIREELAQISTWLTGRGEDRAAICLEDAWKGIAPANWLLEPPLRTRPEGWLNGSQTARGG
jgi:hypothetical protein